MLTNESFASLKGRVDRGIAAIKGSWGYEPEHEDDFDSAVKDAISDILTARFGPAGKLVDGDGGRCKVELDGKVVENASALVEAALQSYFGDAEDYIEAEPVKPVADVDVVVIRDPDFSNEICVFGNDANVVNIDVGAGDLYTSDEWDEWCETQEQAMNLVATKDAQRLIVETVVGYAESFDQEVPRWAAEYSA